MANRSTQLMNNFNSGELSPLMLARVEFPKYKNGCEVMENWIPLPQGGARTTPGTRFVAQAKNATQENLIVRLIPFVVGVSDAYVLELGTLYLRIYKNNGRVDVAGVPVEVTTTYTSTDLASIKLVQDAEHLYLVHPDYTTQVLTRTSDTVWTIADFAPEDGPFLDQNTDLSIYISDLSGGELITNGTLNGSLLGWTNTSAGTGTATYNGGTGRADLVQGAGAGDTGRLLQGLTFIPGKPYTLTLDVFTNNVEVVYGTNKTTGGSIVTTVTPGVGKTVSITGQAGTTYIAIKSVTLSTTASIDNVTMSVPRHTGAAITLVSNTAIWQGAHIGAIWKLTDGNGLPSEAAWVAGAVYSLGARVTNEGHVYECVVNGTSGVKPPVHTQGVQSDGAVSWSYVNDGWGYVQITSYTSGTQVGGVVKLHLPANLNASTIYWSEGAWSSVQGFPRGTTFDQQRLTFCGTDGSPATIWGSELGFPDGFRDGTTKEAATIFDVQSNQVNALLWMVRGRFLFAGTNGGEYSLRGGNDQVIAPDNPPIVEELGAYGSADIQPVKVGQNILFVQRGGRVLREIVFNDTAQSVLGPEDVTILSEHITASGVTELAYQQAPNPTVWVTHADGHLATLTYFPKEDVKAWARHVTPGAYLSVAVIPSSGGHDQVWVAVRRTVGTQTLVTIEYFDDAVVTHGTVSVVNPPTVPITNANHLIGQTVKLIADGELQSIQVVQNDGTVTPTATCAVLDIGIDVTPRLVTVRPEVALADGSSQGRKRRWVKIYARLDTSRAVTINGQLRRLPVPALSGDIEATNLGYDQDGRITITSTDTKQVTLLGLFGTFDTGDA